MIPEFSRPCIADNFQTRSRIRQTVEFLDDEGVRLKTVLDVGRRNDLTDELEQRLNCFVDNTIGDLDKFWWPEKGEYKTIIISHVLEHLRNPWNVIERIPGLLSENGTVYIFLPCRPKFLWSKNHFHEIDKYRLSILLREAGLKITRVKYQKVWRPIKQYFTIRGFLRLFLEWNVIYTVQR